jgi:putative FmdB family regulatory protein
MPTYEYICNKCNNKFSITGSFGTLLSMVAMCPVCKDSDVKKVIFSPAVIYKGKGFYTTDQRGNENEMF